MVRIEFDDKKKSVLTNINFERVWKKEMRLKLGIKAFVLMIPEDEDTTSLAIMKT